ncbi:MAG: class I SAM-dependent methyltransferase [Candidatus Aminicenantes bacterium]|nr:class I SAM-dependent methyltransferase [Candidatus Aminicenantes bacterium]
MNNPWLKISAPDYEGHMGLPEVNQLSFLGDVFKEFLAKYECSSVAYLGCATGNGLEHISNRKTRRLTAIDINPEYLEVLRNRYKSRIPYLEIIEEDLNKYQGNGRQYSLIFAGLLFEYLDPLPLLRKISKWLKKTGILAVVLQLPDKYTKKVSDTPYPSLKFLDPIMKLVSDHDFKIMAKESGLKELEGKRVTLESGKAFYIGAYGKIV